jgi:biopolymer transport protein TolQ
MDSLLTTKTGGVLQVLLTTTPFAKFILLILLVFSIIAWAIIIRKWSFFRRVQRENQSFLNLFRQRSSLLNFALTAPRHEASALPALLAEAVNEWQRLTGRQHEIDLGPAAVESVMPIISEAMNRRISSELGRYENSLSFLATAGSASPFLGLLGTVWGIMKSFMDIRGLPAVNLQVVAPGIADALIVTAAGLLVAVPAVIYYNHFLGRIKDLVSTMERFSSEVASDLRAEFLRRSNRSSSSSPKRSEFELKA